MNGLTKYHFSYGKKEFWCRETTVGDYYLYLKDPEYFLEKKLSEGGKPPKLSELQMKRFLSILLDVKSKTEDIISKVKNKKRSKAEENRIKDLHIRIGVVSRTLHTDCMNMPLEMFWKILGDLKIITGNEEYDPLRNEKTIDSKSLREFTGGKKTI